MYFDVSTQTIFSDVNFQRNVSINLLEGYLGRPANDEENERAKKIPFSVDYVFCDKCEDRFTEIETRFTQPYLDKYRSGAITRSSFIDSTVARAFFLLQVWRTSICTNNFNVSVDTREKLRELILNPNADEQKKFPMIVTYMITSGKGNPYTTNMVGYTIDRGNAVIFFNDFIIQFFQDTENIHFHPIFGLNHKDTFSEKTNYLEKDFLVDVISNEEREEILGKIHTERAEPVLKSLAEIFANMWKKQTGNPPPKDLVKKYIETLVNWSGIPKGQRLSLERVSTFTINFVNDHLGK